MQNSQWPKSLNSPVSAPASGSGRLRAMLIEGTIAPGAKLNERELCEQLKISRTPLREAIKMLASGAWWICCRTVAPSPCRLASRT